MIANRRPAGQTMLELIAATVIIMIALVPALKLTRQRFANTKELEHSELRLTLCTSKLEEELARTASQWDLNTQRGNFQTAGYSDVRFLVSKSDAVAAGGIPDALATIDVTVWHDLDANGTLDPDELSVRLATKLAKLVTYEYRSSVL